MKKMKKPIHEKKVYLNMREVIEDIDKLYSDRTAFSYRIKPNNKDIVKKSYTELCADVRALASELTSRGVNGKHVALVGKLSYHCFLIVNIGNNLEVDKL